MALSIEAIIGAVAVFVSLPPTLLVMWDLIKGKIHKKFRRRGINSLFPESSSTLFVSPNDTKLAEPQYPQEPLPASRLQRSLVTFAISVSDSTLEEGLMHIDRRHCKLATLS